MMFCFFQALPLLSENDYELYKKGLCFVMGWEYDSLESKQQRALKEVTVK